MGLNALSPLHVYSYLHLTLKIWTRSEKPDTDREKKMHQFNSEHIWTITSHRAMIANSRKILWKLWKRNIYLINKKRGRNHRVFTYLKTCSFWEEFKWFLRKELLRIQIRQDWLTSFTMPVKLFLSADIIDYKKWCNLRDFLR